MERHLASEDSGDTMRDLRDPTKLGLKYLQARSQGVPIDRAVKRKVKPYIDGGFISANPADHHSKVDQTLGILDDGGAS